MFQVRDVVLHLLTISFPFLFHPFPVFFSRKKMGVSHPPFFALPLASPKNWFLSHQELCKRLKVMEPEAFLVLSRLSFCWAIAVKWWDFYDLITTFEMDLDDLACLSGVAIVYCIRYNAHASPKTDHMIKTHATAIRIKCTWWYNRRWWGAWLKSSCFSRFLQLP